MGMQINEAGADHQPTRVHHIRGLKRRLADRLDLAGPNADRTHGIQPTLWIDHSAVIYGDIVGRRRLTAGGQ